ncbi:hypothetical protein [Coleofasciculus chthonoplastes]|uniref:hypothetical protein n=1 Tax=Coleofasciculus chthonoplastes TaxID=64178 RepID=UPI0012F79E35|nr:hypothetical protein [Coleofasciculus chthonoplastes]
MRQHRKQNNETRPSPPPNHEIFHAIASINRMLLVAQGGFCMNVIGFPVNFVPKPAPTD